MLKIDECACGELDRSCTQNLIKRVVAMSLRAEVRQLYKNLLHLGRDYPMGYDFFRVRLKRAFLRHQEETDPQQIRQLIERGNYVCKEIEALYMLRKYRTLNKRYYETNTSSLRSTKVAAAELKLCVFVAEHNLPVAILDHLPGLVANVCEDSSISGEIKCGRTKGTGVFRAVLELFLSSTWGVEASHQCVYNATLYLLGCHTPPAGMPQSTRWDATLH
ncbi:Complex 1 LYR protein [Trinorchestia longiramus]|nr:Complex 1 LYR protein [Trinorchestia longiramus]